MTYPKPTVGQSVWFVPGQRGTAQYATVTKVGRKYFECGKWLAFHIDTWREKSESCLPGRAYLDQAQHAHAVKRQEAWRTLHRAISGQHRVPEGIDMIDIQAIASRLGVNLAEGL